MPRRARLELPGIPMHVTQRGVNRCAIFIDDQDHDHYRRVLREACRKHGVAVHAFVLMDNHVHLLLSANQAGRVALAMQPKATSHRQSVRLFVTDVPSTPFLLWSPPAIAWQAPNFVRQLWQGDGLTN